MNAQQIIDTCDKYIAMSTPRQFRNEINIAGIINNVKKQFIIFGNGEGRANSSSECPALPNQITEKEVKHGNTRKNN